VTCYSERAESSQVSAVVERDQTEGNDDKENGFLVDVPAKKKRGVGAEGGSCDKVGPRRAKEQLDQCGLARWLVRLDLALD
jgi:hypothetical protein